MAQTIALDERMKRYYESISDMRLTRRTPVIIRLDGKAFHTLTRNFVRPYDKLFHDTMNRTLGYLCRNIQGCVFGYTQSDEISLLLIDFESLDSAAWFDYRVQKVCSISSSMATLAFNCFFDEAVQVYAVTGNNSEQYDKYMRAGDALFDSRCFNVPKEEVANYFVWRQQDATKNAIQMLGQAYFSHKELMHKNGNQIQDMLFTERGVNFNDMPTEFKRGVCCIKVEDGWRVDTEIPIFTQDRNYIERLIPN